MWSTCNQINTKKKGYQTIHSAKLSICSIHHCEGPATSDRILLEVARKIKSEMKFMGSVDNDSILRDSIQALKQFSWDTVYLELEANIPTLVKLLR